MSRSHDRTMDDSYDQTMDDSDDLHHDLEDNSSKRGAGENVRPRTAKGYKTPAKRNHGHRSNTSYTEADREAPPTDTESVEKSQSSASSHNVAVYNTPNTPSTSSMQPQSSHSSLQSERMRKKASRTYVDIAEDERRIGEQGRFLLNLFIQEQAEDELGVEEAATIRQVCHADKQQARQAGLSDESLTDIALTLRRIGDDISRNTDLNNFIDKVPVDSTKDVFVKVCKQIFQGGGLNWGRVVALFYFAYRLIMRAISQGMDSVPWIRDMIQWAGDFLVKHVARWILSRGGWNMIKEWFGPSNQTWMMLFFASLTFGIWAYFRKD